jgi:uncharacterized protein YacL
MILRWFFPVLVLATGIFLGNFTVSQRLFLAGIPLVVWIGLDFFILPRIPFYRLLTFLVTLVLLSAFLALGAWLFDVQFKIKYQTPILNHVLMFLAIFVLQISAHYGRHAAFFKPQTAEAADAKEAYLIDTSALIDGRVAEIAKAGFLSRTLVVPEFVVKEMQLIADSTVHEKRKKGRRGLAILGEMKAHEQLKVQILPGDIEHLRGVDNKLLYLAKENKARIITTDFNLLKVAQVEGVEVININQMATLLKPAYAVGDQIKVSLVKKGNTRRQAVGYMEDDTMVVVEEGERLIGTTQDMIVTSFLQSETGKIVFCRLA